MPREVFLHSVIVSVPKTAANREPFTVSEQLEGRKGFILLSILLCKHVKGRVCKIGGNTIFMRIQHTNGGQFFIFASATRHYHGSNQGGYQGAANPAKSVSHGKKGSTVYKVSVAQLQLQGRFFGCSHRTVPETPSQVINSWALKWLVFHTDVRSSSCLILDTYTNLQIVSFSQTLEA
jgi:hypothetical protein